MRWWCSPVMGRSLQAQRAMMCYGDMGQQEHSYKMEGVSVLHFSGVKHFFLWNVLCWCFLHQCNQLHDEGKEVAFLAQSSFDMVTPVGTRPLGLLIGCNDDNVRKGDLGASRAWSVCRMRARWGCRLPLTLQSSPLCPGGAAQGWVGSAQMELQGLCTAFVLCRDWQISSPGFILLSQMISWNVSILLLQPRLADKRQLVPHWGRV